MNRREAPSVRTVSASPDDVGQRIDNYLMKMLKGVPKTRIYRALRKGEVRVNGRRIRPHYHLEEGDQVRIPPIRHRADGQPPVVPEKLLERIPVLFEDEHLLVVDKPSGLAVHGGTGIDFGLVEALRELRPELGFLELVHRIDRETSGCLVLALNRPALVRMQQQLVSQEGISKHYLALVRGTMPTRNPITVDAPLQKIRGSDGLGRIAVKPEGRTARTVFRLRQVQTGASLVEAKLITGRMHQVRVHAAHLSHPIAGDRIYGESSFNDRMRECGLGRLFLHAERIRFLHPVDGERIDCHAQLPTALEEVLSRLG